jgi:hypothetical protein
VCLLRLFRKLRFFPLTIVLFRLGRQCGENISCHAHFGRSKVTMKARTNFVKCSHGPFKWLVSHGKGGAAKRSAFRPFNHCSSFSSYRRLASGVDNRLEREPLSNQSDKLPVNVVADDTDGRFQRSKLKPYSKGPSGS